MALKLYIATRLNLPRAIVFAALTAITSPIEAAAEDAGKQEASASIVLPNDVKLAFERAPQDLKSRLCQPNFTPKYWLETEPIQSISGLNSRQDNVDDVENARDLENFAQAFAAYSVLALATNDASLKESLLKTLAAWAREKALLKSASCVSKGRLQTGGKCGEWRDPEGRDLSSMKDATFTTFIGAGLVRSYYVALKDFEQEKFAQEHAEIARWITAWSARLKVPDNVYLGLNVGWYWPSIINDIASGRVQDAHRKLKALDSGLARLIDKEGAIKDRTTRGDRAIWYHYTSIGEVVVSIELMHAAGLRPSEKLEDRLHQAVSLFLRAVDDHKSIAKWAAKRKNSRYKGVQDWSTSWPDNNFAGTWLHIYPYRYPGHPNSAQLRKKVLVSARSAVTDIDLGIGLGCIYNIASSGR